MATLFDLLSGDTITEGVPGCNTCDEGIRMALRIAQDGRRTVILDDDDGEWLIGPRGRVRRFTAALQRRYGFAPRS